MKVFGFTFEKVEEGWRVDKDFINLAWSYFGVILIFTLTFMGWFKW